jgi:hypothetical protein
MWSKGICWIDDCRIPFVDGDSLVEHQIKYGVDSDYGKDCNTKFGQIKNSVICGSNQGRFPANILVSDDMLNDGSIGKGQKTQECKKQPEDMVKTILLMEVYLHQKEILRQHIMTKEQTADTTT